MADKIVEFLEKQGITSINSSKVKVDFDDSKEGLIRLRKGIPYLDLGNREYAQVRIVIDGTYYVDGMAIYQDEMPKDIDVLLSAPRIHHLKLDGPCAPFDRAIGEIIGALNIVLLGSEWRKKRPTKSEMLAVKMLGKGKSTNG